MPKKNYYLPGDKITQTGVGGAMDATHIYYDMTVTNDNSSVRVNAGVPSLGPINNIEKPLNFNQNRSQPYLVNPSEYYLAVQRFTILTPNLPVFIAQPIVGQSNVNKTIYTVTAYNTNFGFISQQNIIWIPQDDSVPVPSTPIKPGDVNNAYYYCYNYEQFINCVNIALSNATNAVAFGVPPLPQPYIVYDRDTQLFNINGTVTNWRTSSTGATLGNSALNQDDFKLFMNVELYNLFSSLPGIYVAGTPSSPTLGADYQILFLTGSDIATANAQPYITNVFTGLNNQNTIKMVQEYTTLPLWSPVKSIIFTGSLIHTVAELQATPVIYQNGSQNINQGKPNTEILPIIVEHIVTQTAGTESKPYVLYEPTGEYRLVDLYGETPVYGFQFNVFWKDNFGNLVPFNLVAGMVATLKVLFRKKIFNSDLL
jgi:hypothetical protein